MTKSYLIIERGDGKIFKGDDDNSRFEAGDEIELDDDKAAIFIERGFITAIKPKVGRPPKAEASE